MTLTEVLVPLKAFSRAKQRLGATYSGQARLRLVQAMASTVVAAAEGIPTWIVSDDAEVSSWADSLGLRTLTEPARGLNIAIQQAVESRARQGVTRIIIAHGDLPLARSLSSLVDLEGVQIVTDQARTGTKVLSLPTATDFKFQYGSLSASRHKFEAQRHDLPVEIVNDPELSFDVNTLEDLGRLSDRDPELFEQLTSGVATAAKRHLE